MTKFEETYERIMYESFNSTYPYKWTKMDERNGEGEFTDASGNTIEFGINDHGEDGEGSYDVAFLARSADLRSTFNLTGASDGLRVFSTVIAMMEDYVSRYEDRVRLIVFDADSVDKSGGKESDTNRGRLYARMVKKLVDPNVWDVAFYTHNGLTEFHLRHKKNSQRTKDEFNAKYNEVMEDMTAGAGGAFGGGESIGASYNPDGGPISGGDNYATGDARMPKVIGAKSEKKKKKKKKGKKDPKSVSPGKIDFAVTRRTFPNM